MPTFVGLGIVPARKEVLATESGEIVISERGQAIEALSTNNDLDIDEGGNLRLVYDAEAVGQHARQRLMFFKSEWFLDPTVGVDWFGQILGFAESRMPLAEATVKRVLLQTPGVTGLRTVTTDFDRAIRGIRVGRCEVETQFDDTAAV